ncbi:glycosyl transferase family protein [Maritimibacter alkaliphilus]|uniref:glycosyl transferase family protein n=1 Tax=Maritimibacter alkaliphilus TaxID=404236 RepID=UPI001C978DDC|nr:glycosyl transferase family protein [Maritimibacter alkaliphilus]MBY6091328.1 glycosyl transferase family protein [Maritimibacter alkaliphilus]
MTLLAPYVRILARGPGRSRNLTRGEAETAMTLILQGDVSREAVGAMLMLMRYRGENAEELAGFVSAMRRECGAYADLPVAVDWPSYAAGRTRGLPWFLLAAKLVAEATGPVLLHGWNSHQGSHASVREALPALNIPIAGTPEALKAALETSGIAYLPTETAAPRSFDLLRLREVLGLRSPVNTALRLLNPANAPVSLQGVFHPPFLTLQADAAHLLGQPNQTVLKGGGGEFERNPAKPVPLHGLRDGTPWEGTAPALLDETRRLSETTEDPEMLIATWNGTYSDPFVTGIITGTAALALLTAGKTPCLEQAQVMAEVLWADREVLAPA